MINDTEQLIHDTSTLLTWLDAQFNGRIQGWIRSEEQRIVQANVWAAAIKTMTSEQRHRACAMAKRAAARGDTPPTAQQFRRFGFGESAHQPFPALSAPEITPEQRKANIDRIGREIKKSRFMRRCLTRLGYGPTEHAAALSLARAEGRSLYAVDMAAMIENGWSEDLEAQHRRGWMAVPGNRLIAANGRPDRRALYTPGREPPDWVIRAGVQELATVENWIAEQAAAAVAQAAAA